MAFIPDEKESSFTPDKPSVAASSFQDDADDKSQMGFLERLKFSFGDKETRGELHESESGFAKGGFKEFAGDVADVGGAAFPIIGGFLGALGGTVAGFGVGSVPGAAIGVTAGEGARQSIGQLLGVRGGSTAKEEVIAPVKEGAITLVGGKVLQKVGGYAASRFPKLLGIFTGESDDAVRAAMANPREADLALKNGDEVLRNAVNEAAEKSIQLREGFYKGYQESFEKISSVYGNRTVNRDNVIQKFNELLTEKGVVFGKDGTLDFATSKIVANPGEVTKIKQAVNAIQKWDDWSLNGVVKLRQLVGGLTKFPNESGGASKSPLLGNFYHFMNEEIKRNLPQGAKKEYEHMNRVFSQNIDMFDDMVEAFNKGDAFTRVAGIFGKNRDELRTIIQFYEKEAGGDSIQGIVAGREIGLEKTAAFGFLNPRSWVDFFISPSAQGKVITAPSQIVNTLSKPFKDEVIPTPTVDQFLSR